jgi:protease IV
MSQDDQKPPADQGPTLNWGSEANAPAPGDASGPPNAAPPAPPLGPPPPPGMYPGYPVPLAGAPPPRGFLRRHPLLIVLFILVGAVAFITVLAVAVSGAEGTDGMSFGKRVGVIKIEGVITDSVKVVKQIHRFRDDKTIKAVVVRIESPGGVVAPSQEIYSELKKLAQKKPVVASMGAVAASGGYYVACPAKTIYANPGTITGSIGVVMQLANLEGLFEWMKIKNMNVKSGKFKDIGSSTRPMTEEEKKILQEFVNNVHQQFEAAVAEGREMDKDKVHELANGSIYTGEQAKELGLVDELGTLWDAIDQAAKDGGIEGEPKVVWPSEDKPNIFSAFGSWYEGVAGARERLSSPVRVMYLLQVGLE